MEQFDTWCGYPLGEEEFVDGPNAGIQVGMQAPDFTLRTLIGGPNAKSNSVNLINAHTFDIPPVSFGAE